MEDLSHFLPGGDPISALIGGSVMEAGGQVFDTSEALAGPGSPPVAFPDHNVQAYGPPRITESPLGDGGRPNVIAGDDPQPYAPFDTPGEGGWHDASDDAGAMTGGWRVP